MYVFILIYRSVQSSDFSHVLFDRLFSFTRFTRACGRQTMQSSSTFFIYESIISIKLVLYNDLIYWVINMSIKDRHLT